MMGEGKKKRVANYFPCLEGVKVEGIEIWILRTKSGGVRLYDAQKSNCGGLNFGFSCIAAF